MYSDWFVSDSCGVSLYYRRLPRHDYIYARYLCIRRSQWPRGLRRRSTAARLLRSWVRIPLGAWLSVCCDCCVLSGRGLCVGLIIRSEESYRLWRVVVCALGGGNPRGWGEGQGPLGAIAPKERERERDLCIHAFPIVVFSNFKHLYYYYYYYYYYNMITKSSVITPKV